MQNFSVWVCHPTLSAQYTDDSTMEVLMTCRCKHKAVHDTTGFRNFLGTATEKGSPDSTASFSREKHCDEFSKAENGSGRHKP